VFNSQVKIYILYCFFFLSGIATWMQRARASIGLSVSFWASEVSGLGSMPQLCVLQYSRIQYEVLYHALCSTITIITITADVVRRSA
jgi:hypothetical protein